MPELPEVETIRRDLERSLSGVKVEDVEVRHPKSASGMPQELREGLQSQRFVAFERKGKLLQCKLSSGLWLLVHLKMTGQCIVRRAGQVIGGGGHPSELGELPNAHTRIIITCEDDLTWFFNDLRIFGWMRLADEKEREECLAELGQDAYLVKPSVTELQAYCTRYPKRNLKQMLLDQAFIAGIGNIYADEIAYDAIVAPERPLSMLESAELERIANITSLIISKAVELRGTSFRNFVDGDGHKGGYLPYLKAYGRANTPCGRCGVVMKKAVVAQRGTTWCPNCQR